MIRLLIKDYTLQEKMVLYDSLHAALSEAYDYGRSVLVFDDLQKALYWLEKQIGKEVPGNAQNC